MRYTISILVMVLSFALYGNPKAQVTTDAFELEVEPVAYILGGAGATVGYQHGPWTYSLEAFGGLTVPESLHGNTHFRPTLRGLEFQAERFLSGNEGWYMGPEFGISRLKVTHLKSDESVFSVNYSLGFRGGYQWQTGIGDLYLNPLAGVSYALNAEDIEINGEVFESGSVTPFATLGIGWSF